VNVSHWLVYADGVREQVVAESLLDRLINTSQQVVMNGPSYRPNKRPKAAITKA
jgi:DNA replication protein DnaC